MLKKQHELEIKNFGKPKNDDFNFDLIGLYFRNKNHNSDFQILSDKVCNDLDFHQLFTFLDRTTSGIGQQFFYNKLRIINKEPANNEPIVDFFSRNERARNAAILNLLKLKKHEAYYLLSLFQNEYLKPPKWLFIAKLLLASSCVTLLFAFINPASLLLLFPIVITNLVLHYWNKQNIYSYSSSIPQLIKSMAVAKELLKIELPHAPNDKVIKSIKSLEELKNRMLLFEIESRVQNDLSSISWLISESIKIFFLIEPNVVFNVLKLLKNKKADIQTIYEFIGGIDSAISVASLREGTTSYCIPKFTESAKVIEFENIYHPLISDCVINSLNVNNKSILLTGSNMSGKTTFIRTVAINTILAQTINTCFANQFTLPLLKIYSAIRITDDSLNEKSYYFEEVLTVKELIKESESETQNLFLLDELFKGTNTIERISAGKAVLSYLNQKNNIVFVSTHDIELCDLLSDDYNLYHFTEIVENKEISFDYKLKSGNLKTRNAIRILEINNYPAQITDEAKSISQRMEKITTNYY